MILLIALRNLLRHFRHTLLLILLIAFITMVFLIGSSLIFQSDKGLRQTYVENLTADLMIQKTGEISMNLFGANTPVIDEYFTIPVLPVYNNIISVLSDNSDIASSASLVSGKALMDVLGIREAVPLTGVELPDYFDLFDGIKLQKGRFLEPGEFGIMLTQDRVERLEKRSKKELSIGTPIKLTYAGSSSFKIREVPLVGIYSYENPGPYMDQIILCDPQTVRTLSSVLNPAAGNVEISHEETDLFGDDLEDLFGDESMTDDLSFDQDSLFDFDNLKEELTDREYPADSYGDGGDWNFMLLRVNDGVNPTSLQASLNRELKEYGVKVVDWRTAAGNTALTVLMIQVLFYVGIFLACLVGGISIVNIVLISVFRRTREIGTLRAIGASDHYIYSIILMENILLSLMAGLVGVSAGYYTLNQINIKEIVLPNQILAALLGQTVLNIQLIPPVAIGSVVLAVALGVISSIYPGVRAVRIPPIEAVRRG